MTRRRLCGGLNVALALALPFAVHAQGADAAAAADPPATASDAQGMKEEAFEWNFAWRDWEGLTYYASQPTKFKAPMPAVPLLDLSEVKVAGTIGGRLEFDGAAFDTGGTLSGFDDGFELRRARITAKGSSIFALPFSYRVDLGYVPGKFTVTQAYVVVPDVPHLGELQVGQFTPPVALQMITSSWDIGLMEPAAPLQALAPDSRPGVQGHDTYDEGRGTWTLGAYASVRATGEYGSGGKSFGNVMGRLTWLALDAIDDRHPAANHYLHLGASANLQVSRSGSLRFRSRPESYIAPYVIDTGDIEASKAVTAGVELLWTDGPFSAQAELIHSRVVAASAGENLQFGGLYAQTSWFLTGESRPYDRGDGAPGRLHPRHDFGFGPSAGWGALELAARVSYTDLNDGAVQGGRLSMAMLSLNWYLRPQLKWMFELGAGRVSDAPSNGNIVLGQTRLGLYFF